VRGSHKERRNSTRIPEIRQLVTQMNNLHVNIFQRDSIRDAVQSALSAGLEKKRHVSRIYAHQPNRGLFLSRVICKCTG